MRHAHAFTLIELMVVVAIIAILAFMAMPSMLDGVIRKQIREGIALADIAEVAVQRIYQNTGELPSDNKAAGLPDKDRIVGNVVQEIAVDHGAVTVLFGNNSNSALKGKRITMIPAVVTGEPTVPIAWKCNGARIPGKMTAMGRNLTDVPAGILPIECRLPG